MKIKIANKVFEIHFLFEKEYLPFFASYLVEEDTPDYFLYQETYEEDNDKGFLKIESKSYDLYESNGVDVHYHKDEETSEYVGKIIYGEKYSFSTKNLHDVEHNIKLIHYALTRILMDALDCVLIKGSAFAYKDKGLMIISSNKDAAFKYTELWDKYEEVVCINGYINFLVLEDDKLKIYGNPWSSNINVDNNIIVDLSNVIFLYEDDINQLIKLEKTEAFLKITNQVVTPQNDRGLEAMNKVIDKIVSLDNYLLFAKFNKESVNIVKNIIDCL